MQSKNTKINQQSIKTPLKRRGWSGASESPSETFWSGQQLSKDVAMRITSRRQQLQIFYQY